MCWTPSVRSPRKLPAGEYLLATTTQFTVTALIDPATPREVGATPLVTRHREAVVGECSDQSIPAAVASEEESTSVGR